MITLQPSQLWTYSQGHFASSVRGGDGGDVLGCHSGSQLVPVADDNFVLNTAPPLPSVPPPPTQKNPDGNGDDDGNILTGPPSQQLGHRPPPFPPPPFPSVGCPLLVRVLLLRLPTVPLANQFPVLGTKKKKRDLPPPRSGGGEEEEEGEEQSFGWEGQEEEEGGGPKVVGEGSWGRKGFFYELGVVWFG